MGMPNLGQGQTPPESGEQTQPETTTETKPEAPKSEVITLTKDEYEAMRSDTDRAKGYAIALAKQLSETMAQRTQEPEMPHQERQAAIKELLDQDPESALNAHFEQRIAPILQGQRQTLASLNRERAIEKVGQKEWSKWGSKIEEFMAPFDEATKAQPGAWENAYNFVRLQHLDTIVEERMREKMQEQQRGALLEGSTSHAASSNRMGKALSPIEKQIASEFGMSEEDWQKYGSGDYAPSEEGN